MDEEIKVIVKNDTCELITLSRGHKAINVKWVYKMKRNASGETERRKARLVANAIVKKLAFIMMRYLLYSPTRNYQNYYFFG